MRGVVVSVDKAAKTAVVNAGKIEGWMDAMTMEYPFRDAADLEKLSPGDHITATVEVRDLDYSVTGVRKQ